MTNPPFVTLPRQTRAFTLVELLVVIGLIVLIVAISVPAFGTFARSAGLSSSANKLLDHLSLARQTAISQNRAVEFRLYNVPESKTSNTLYYQAFRLLSLTGTTANDLVKVQYLDSGVIINDSPTLSSLIGEAGTNGTTSPTRSTSPLPGNREEFNYVAFQFRPNGSTDLPSEQANSWFLTLHAKNAKTDGPAAGLPKNFITIQLDPSTGRAKILRP